MALAKTKLRVLGTGIGVGNSVFPVLRKECPCKIEGGEGIFAVVNPNLVFEAVPAAVKNVQCHRSQTELKITQHTIEI